jgi:hypothetical protein
MRTVLLILLGSTVAFAQTAPPIQFRGGPPASKHAAIETGPQTLTAAAGAKVALTVDMTPKAGVHVYAPGAKDYLPVKLTLKSQPDVKVGKLTYPKAEMMFFAPLNETVPVFDKTFRLTQDLTLAKSLKAGSTVTVTGTVDFQACDDKLCFVPESVPVIWTVTVR